MISFFLIKIKNFFLILGLRNSRNPVLLHLKVKEICLTLHLVLLMLFDTLVCWEN